MTVEIDEKSGYCFGVEYAVDLAEEGLKQTETLYCLGDIVHNSQEVERLSKMGLTTIDKEQFKKLKNCKVLIRAHGEPPETYKTAIQNNIQLIDASCPVVLKLQNRIKHAYDKMKKQNGQIVIYGKKGHAEIVGLSGQTNNEAIIVMEDADLEKIDKKKPVILFSQTTKSKKGFYGIKAKIEERLKTENKTLEEVDLTTHDSICRQVSNREPQMQSFAKSHDIILFVAGRKSSNGKALYQICLQNNPRSYFIESDEELNSNWFSEKDKVGICGATSTPQWLMKKVEQQVKKQFS